MSDTAGLILGGASAIAAECVVVYFVARITTRRAADRTAAPLASPPCDRCRKPTGRPYLRQTPRTAWLCPTCEAQVTDLMLAQFSPGRWITDPDETP